MIFFGVFPLALYETRVRPLIASKVLPGLLLAGFVLQCFVLPGGADRVLKNLMLTPDTILSFRLVTHIFVTPGLASFAVDLLFLWLFTAAIENRMGTWRALIVFSAGLVAGTALQVAGNAVGLTETYRAGAAAGVYGLIGAFLVIMPFADARIAYFYWIFIIFFGSGVTRCGAFILVLMYLFLPQVLGFWMPFTALEMVRNAAQMSFYNMFPWLTILGGVLAGGGLAGAWYGFSGMTETEEERAMREGQAARELRRQIARDDKVARDEAARLEAERSAAGRAQAGQADEPQGSDNYPRQTTAPPPPDLSEAAPWRAEADAWTAEAGAASAPVEWDSGVPDMPQIDLHSDDAPAEPPAPAALSDVPGVQPTPPGGAESRRGRFRALADNQASPPPQRDPGEGSDEAAPPGEGAGESGSHGDSPDASPSGSR